MALTEYQKFEAATILRSEIRNAPYNPRKISDENRKRLKENIKRVGILDTLVVNKRTMNLVSGHQRLAILDQLEKGRDYELTVSLVDLTEEEEKEQNIFFNNSRSQGEWDTDMLKALSVDIDMHNTGFADEDLALLGIEMDIEALPGNSDDDDIAQFSRALNETKARQKEQAKVSSGENTEEQPQQDPYSGFATAREKRVDMINKASSNNADSMDTYVTITFSNSDAKKAFMLRFGYEKELKYIKGEEFSDKIERVDL